MKTANFTSRVRGGVPPAEVGDAEVRAAYDFIHADYDNYWLAGAGPSIDALIARLPWRGGERVYEAGCGTGYATRQLAARAAEVIAVDLSAGMLGQAEARLAQSGRRNVRFLAGDALERLTAVGRFDLVFTTWVLGYIRLEPFFAAAWRALAPGGRLAFLVHQRNSPREPHEIFAEIAAGEPTALRKRVAFDFPHDTVQIRTAVETAGFAVETLAEDHIDFTYDTAAEVLQHLLKSGAGTAYYDAVDPVRRPALMARFLQRLAERRAPGATRYTVNHEYFACIARKT